MTTLSSTIQIYDRFSGPLKNYMSALQNAGKASESLKQSMNMPTGKFSGLGNEVDGLGNKATKTGGIFKTMLGANLVSSAAIAGISAITRGVGEITSALSSSSATWKTFQGNMEQLGKSPQQIGAAKQAMQDYATKTIYSASDMASTYAQLAAVGTKNTGQLVKGFGGLAAASENPAQAMKTLSQQATQMAAKPMVQWADFKLMLEQSPAGMAAVAKSMGISTGQLIKNIQNGTVKTQDFFNAVQKTGTNANFTKMATQFKTVGQAADGLKETLVNALQPAFDKVSQIGINAISGLSNIIGKIDFSALADKVIGVFTTIGNTVKSFWNTLKGTGAITALASAFDTLKSGLSYVVAMLTQGGNGMNVVKSAAQTLGTVLNVAASAISAFGIWLLSLDPSNIQLVTKLVDGAIKSLESLFNFVNSNKDWLIPLVVGITAGIIAFVAINKAIVAFKTTMAITQTVVAVGSALVGMARGSQAAGSALTFLASESKIAAVAQGVLNAVMAINPFVLIIAGITALVAGIAWWVTQTKSGQAAWQAFTTFIQNAWSGMVTFFQGVWVGIINVFSVAMTSLQTFWQLFMNFLINSWQGTGAFLTNLWNSIVAVFTTIWNFLVPIIQTIITIIVGYWTGFVGTISGIWNSLIAIGSTIWNTIMSVIISLASATINGVISAWNTIIGFASAIWNSVNGVVSGVWNSIRSTAIGGANAVISGVQSAWSGLSGMVSGIWNGIRSIIYGALNINLFSAGAAIMNGFLSGLKSVWGSITSFVGGIASWIKEHKGPISYDAKLLIPAGNAIMGGFGEALNNSFKNVKQSVSSYAGQVSDMFNGQSMPVTLNSTPLAFNNTPLTSTLSSDGLTGTTTNNTQSNQNVTYSFGAGSIVLQSAGNGETGEQLLEKFATALRSASNRSLANG